MTVIDTMSEFNALRVSVEIELKLDWHRFEKKINISQSCIKSVCGINTMLTLC